jgi:hypothetical protein
MSEIVNNMCSVILYLIRHQQSMKSKSWIINTTLFISVGRIKHQMVTCASQCLRGFLPVSRQGICLIFS